MTKKITLAAIAATTLAFSAQACAMSGIYLNGNAGYLHHSPERTAEGVKDSNNHFGWDVFIGYNVDMTDEWGVGIEGGYGQFGHSKTTYTSNLSPALDDSTKLEQSALMALAVVTLHADEDLDVFAKAGAAFGETKASVKGNLTLPILGLDADTHTSKSRRTMPMVAFGAAYNVLPSLGITLTWEHLFGSVINSNSFTGKGSDIKLQSGEFQTLDTVMLGFKYTFEIEPD